MSKIKIFSVDDSNGFLDAVDSFFKPFPDQYELVGRFGAVQDDEGVDDLLETIEATVPDVVLMDFGFQLVNRSDDFGIELTRQICKLFPEQKVIMLTEDSPFSNEAVLSKLRRSFLAGATAYLRKDEPHTWMVCIKETVKSGKPTKPIPDSVLDIIKDRLTKTETFNLTNREIEVIRHLADDKTLRSIAEEMGIGYDGVVFHSDNAKIKLSVKTLHGLIAKAFRFRIVI